MPLAPTSPGRAELITALAKGFTSRAFVSRWSSDVPNTRGHRAHSSPSVPAIVRCVGEEDRIAIFAIVARPIMAQQ
jgi:hypothetical protein